MGYNGDMTGDERLASLGAGESVPLAHGERVGRSQGGWPVRLRRRVTAAGFVVTTGAPVAHDATNEVVTSEWATANAAFDRLMKRY